MNKNERLLFLKNQGHDLSFVDDAHLTELAKYQIKNTVLATAWSGVRKVLILVKPFLKIKRSLYLALEGFIILMDEFFPPKVD